MTDALVASALRSDVSLVVVEAPAGCGKTHQGAAYAGDIAPTLGDGRLLILTHTHAAREVFTARTRTASSRVEIRTIDSFITEIGSMYHAAIGLPPDVIGWARTHKNGYDDVASRVARLLAATPALRDILAHRYPVAVFDEHQDASVSQNDIALALRAGGARLRVFGDPMQAIYADKSDGFAAGRKRWEDLCSAAHGAVALSTPHRWANANSALGQWVLAAHAALKRREPLDLTADLPDGFRVVRADNLGDFKYRPAPAVATEMRQITQGDAGALVLTYRNDTAKVLHGAVGRSIPIWEGHTRSALEALAVATGKTSRPDDLCAAVIAFVQEISVGFSDTAFAARLLKEVQSACSKRARGMPATLQVLARCLLDDPSHRGVAAFLTGLERLTREDSAFAAVHFHHPRELRDAMQFADHEDADACLAMLAQQRAHRASAMPRRAISTIHKSKGLETDRVLIVPLDAKTFPDSDAARCLLYVAISRAKSELTLVVPNVQPSPLLTI